MSESLPEWFSYLKMGLCHRKGIDGLKNIIDTGFIRPNDGSFRSTYPQIEVSYARVNNLVPLFDFETPSKDQILQQMRNWYSFFVDHKPVVIAIMLNRQQLADKLISNQKAVEETKGKYYPIFIPHVEVFYPDPIPNDVITGYLIICSGSASLYQYIQYNGSFQEIFHKIDQFVEKYKEVYQDHGRSP